MSLALAKSPHTVHATVDRLLAAVTARGITVFARIDHAAGARAAGLELADEEVLIFGDPRAGTLVMQGDPEIGYELPLRMLVWDAAGGTRVGYRRASELAEQYAVADRSEVLARMDGLMEQLVGETIAP
jgi:uncharacterized protein (DUF302 family)